MDTLVNLRESRKIKGLTMKQLGDLVGLSESAISCYELGKRSPEFLVALKLADVLETTIFNLYGLPEIKKEADGSVVGLSEDELALLQLFRVLKPDAQRSILAAARAFVDTQLFDKQ